MTDADNVPCVTTFANTIMQWPTMYKDLNGGADTANWAKATFEVFAPALLDHLFFSATEEVALSIPVFMDDNPVVSSQVGSKVRWHGKARQGVLVFTDDALTYVREDRSSKDATMWGQRTPLAAVHALNAMQFGFTMISMTSAGPGYEILLRDDDGPARILFRVALDPRQGESSYHGLLRRHLHLI